MDLRPDRDGPIYRWRPSIDDDIYDGIRNLAVEQNLPTGDV
jgi:hypothetical protein